MLTSLLCYADDQELPVAFLVLSSVGGSVVGAVVGGFLEGQPKYLLWTTADCSRPQNLRLSNIFS